MYIIGVGTNAHGSHGLRGRLSQEIKSVLRDWVSVTITSEEISSKALRIALKSRIAKGHHTGRKETIVGTNPRRVKLLV